MESKLGFGSFGEIYSGIFEIINLLAQNLITKKEVAIKMVTHYVNYYLGITLFKHPSSANRIQDTPTFQLLT